MKLRFSILQKPNRTHDLQLSPFKPNQKQKQTKTQIPKTQTESKKPKKKKKVTLTKRKSKCEDCTVAGSAVLKGSRQILQASSKTSSFSPDEDAVETNGFSKEDEEKLRFDILGL